ncbi:MAG: hypothetical protein BMS9Abin05_1175 [Rhodothermia bacterium]|nr:MAG: hypothetical protein BMS9Abin05_1175 [Rhodothermia bacterium]
MDIVERRYQITLAFLTEVLPPPARILDLGIENPLAGRMRELGYDVVNTPDVDLDHSPQVVAGQNVDAVTAFEILEHLVNPFSVLSAIDVPQLIATVPLRLWFATAYRNPEDEFDQHFHEFEPWQFDRLVEKSGWEISSTKTWTGPTGTVGIRPLLRRFTPRYYAVNARRRITSPA